MSSRRLLNRRGRRSPFSQRGHWYATCESRIEEALINQLQAFAGSGERGVVIQKLLFLKTGRYRFAAGYAACFGSASTAAASDRLQVSTCARSPSAAASSCKGASRVPDSATVAPA